MPLLSLIGIILAVLAGIYALDYVLNKHGFSLSEDYYDKW